jgi:hypothetical protein
MSDSKDLLVPDRSIVSIDEAKRELSEKKRTTGTMDDWVSRRDMVKIIDKISAGIGEASASVGQQVYDAISEETAQNMEKLEAGVTERVLAAIDARSLRGRIRKRAAILDFSVRERIHAVLVSAGLATPKVPAPAVTLMPDEPSVNTR